MGLGGFLKKATLAPLKATKKALTGHPIAAVKEAVKPLQTPVKKKRLPAFGKALYGKSADMD